jgi:hypothetical protein
LTSGESAIHSRHPLISKWSNSFFKREESFLNLCPVWWARSRRQIKLSLVQSLERRFNETQNACHRSSQVIMHGFIGTTQKPLILPWLQQNCRMYWPNSKQCTSQNAWNSVAIAGITVWRPKKGTLKGTLLISRDCCSGHKFGPETVQLHYVAGNVYN